MSAAAKDAARGDGATPASARPNDTAIPSTAIPNTTVLNTRVLRFEIVTGIHQGAVLMLDPGDYRIGSSPDADIVLSDPGVAAAHAALHIDFDGVSLDAIGGDLTVGHEPLPRSRGCRVRLPVSFAVGPARIALADPSRRRARRSLRSPLVAAVAGVVVALTVLTTRQIASRDGAAPAPPERQVAGPVAAPPAAPRPARADTGTAPAHPAAVKPAAAPPPPTVDEAFMALNAQLDAADIHSLDIVAEDGRLIVKGTLAGREAAAWPPIQQWFDKSYGRKFPLSVRIVPAAPPKLPALQIQAVWHGDRPYVLLSDGEHYFKGAVLDNGWVISDILRDRLVLAKDGNTVSLTYH